MKIEKIEIRNIASIADASIDFLSDEFIREPVFLITGETGSGKSTILDAITLALYKKTSRLNGVADPYVKFRNGTDELTAGDINNVARKGTSYSRAAVTYRANDGRRYVSEIIIRRSRGRSDGNFQPPEMSLSRQTDDGGWYEIERKPSGVVAANVSITGLGYDQFVKTVILPQGGFSNFLKSNSNEKAEILEKLTGTEIFGKISTGVYAGYNEAKMLADQVKLKIDTLKGALMSGEEKDDAILKKEETAAKLTVAETDKNDGHNALVLAIKAGSAGKSLAEAAERMQEAYKRLNSPEIISRSSELRSLKEKEKEIKLLESCDALLKEKDEMFAGTESDRKMMRDKIADVFMVSEAAGFLDRLALEAIGRWDEETAGLDRRAEEALKVKTAAEERKNVIEYRILQENFRKERNRYAALLKERDDLEKEMSALLDEERLCRESAVNAKKNLEKASMTVSELVVRLRQSLKQGDICPVCGSRIDSVINAGNEIFDSLYEDAEKECAAAEKSLEDVISRKDVSGRKLAGTVSEMQLRKQLMDKAEALLREKGAEPEGACAAEYPDGYDAVMLAEEMDKVSMQIADSVKIMEEVKSAKDIVRDRKSKTMLLRPKYISRKEEASRMLMEFPRSVFPEGTLRELMMTSEISAGNHSFEKTEANMLVNSDSIADARSFAAGLAVRISELDRKNSEILKVRKMISETVGEDESRCRALMSRRDEIMSYEKDLEDLRKESDEARGMYNSAIVKASAIRKELGNAPDGVRRFLDYELLDNLLDEKRCSEEGLMELLSAGTAGLQKTLSELDIIHTGLVREHSSICQRLDNDMKIKREIEHLENDNRRNLEVLDKWMILNEAFGSQSGVKFRKIAQKYIYGILIANANGHLGKMMHGRYQLCPGQDDESLMMLVKDHDMADSLRPVSTLSGGETFIISLSLALGLSSMTGREMNIRSLFIDEGFGALSDNELEQVLEVLHELGNGRGRKREERCLVGIISHVEALRERIGTRVNVVKNGTGTSSVTVTGK